MFGETADKQSSIKSFIDDLVEQHHDVCHLVLNSQVDDFKVVLCVQHVQVFNDLLIGDIPLTERYRLVEDTQRIAHTAICLLSNDSQCLFLILHALFLCHGFQMTDGVTHRHTLEVIDLTTTQDGRQNLMFLGGGKDEDDMGRGLFQRLQEGVEGSRGEHVYLVDDEHLVFAYLWWDACLFHQCLDVLHGVVGGSIQLKDIERALLVESLTTLTVSARLSGFCRTHTVNSLGEDTGTGGFSHTSGTAEEVGVSEFSALYRILQRGGQRLLTDHCIKRGRSVFSRRNDIFFHKIH